MAAKKVVNTAVNGKLPLVDGNPKLVGGGRQHRPLPGCSGKLLIKLEETLTICRGLNYPRNSQCFKIRYLCVSRRPMNIRKSEKKVQNDLPNSDLPGIHQNPALNLGSLLLWDIVLHTSLVENEINPLHILLSAHLSNRPKDFFM